MLRFSATFVTDSVYATGSPGMRAIQLENDLANEGEDALDQFDLDDSRDKGVDS
ncbi:MAG: hypothetical protein ABSA21_03215 [Candidatus Limnocylindrales bacterium]